MKFEVKSNNDPDGFVVQIFKQDESVFKSRPFQDFRSAEKIKEEIQSHYTAGNLGIRVAFERNLFYLELRALEQSVVAKSKPYESFEDCLRVCKQLVGYTKNQLKSCQN